jgi:hypothetical protein
MSAKIPSNADVFQIRIRLQHISGRVNDWLNCGVASPLRSAQIEEILFALAGTGKTAGLGGLDGFMRVCLLVSERVEPFRRRGFMPASVLELLRAWIADANRYLRRPQSTILAAELIRHLSDPRWGSWPDSTEREAILRELAAPPA